MATFSSSGRRAEAGATNEASLPSAADADNYYQTLGVPYMATRAQITRAYRKAMKRIHPDRQRPDRRAAAEEQAKRLNLAYATLSKPAQRQAYDRTIRAQVVQDQLMSRYVGGFHVPPANGVDPLAAHLRRDQTPAERREQAEADRHALVTLLIIFGGITFVVIAALLLWALAAALFGAMV